MIGKMFFFFKPVYILAFYILGLFWLFCRKFTHFLVYFTGLNNAVLHRNWQTWGMKKDMKSPTAFWNHRGLDLQKKRGSVLVRQHWKQGGIVHSARAHLQAFRDRSSLTHKYELARWWHCVVLLCPTRHITRRRLVTMLSYISLPPRYVSFGRCPSVRACPFTSVVKSCHREDWVFVNEPHCLHTHHMYVPVPPLSPWRDVARCHSASSLIWDFLGFRF